MLFLFVAALLAAIELCVCHSLDLRNLYTSGKAQVLSREDGSNPAASPLVNFQVSEPLNLPQDTKKCTTQLLRRVFANSYYHPEIIDYVPPTDCGEVGSWAGISLNWTATSNGTQYDRLSGVTLHNVEIWRTSTAEPTRDGIIWTVLKDVTKYTPLFSKPGRLILDLNNVVVDNLNGEFDVRLSMTVYASSEKFPPAKSSSVIIPLSTLKSNDGNAASVPPTHVNNVSLPLNAVQAFVELQASGNGQEEFWYFNVPDEYLPSLPANTAFGKGPFREVRISVDGQLAGVAFPFAVLFTGAMVPSVWRPIPAYGAFDLPTYNVDLTPWVPLLADGKNHTIALEVASSEADSSINGNWYLSGNIQVTTSSSSKPTTGQITYYDTKGNSSKNKTTGPNETLSFWLNATRSLEVHATVIAGDGSTNSVVWKQNLDFSNRQNYTSDNQIVRQTTTGTSVSTHNGTPVISDTLDFPLNIDILSAADNTGSGYTAIFNHLYTRSLLPNPLLVWSNIFSQQSANGTYITNPNPGFSRRANGTNLNSFSYSDMAGYTYSRKVGVTNNEILYDTEHATKTGFSSINSFSDSTDLGVGRLPGGRTS